MPHVNLYTVDNSTEDQSVKAYLNDWCSVSKQMDIATGYLEIGGLLELDGNWQKLDKIRIILGNEVTARTNAVLLAAVNVILARLKDSVDSEQERNEFLLGVLAILHALKTKRIECRVFDKNKFHAKAYITYFRDDYLSRFIQSMNVPAGYALVGSSNFTKAGLTQNIELNVQIKDDVEQLQDWFEDHWEQGVDITEAILSVIETHIREYSPYDVYLRSMFEYFKTREETVTEWENHESVVYPVLAKYQRDGYNSMIEIANRYNGAFCCDGVGLGKTFIGMMLIERFVKKERRNVVLIVPAAARISVWETTIKKYLPEILDSFYPFRIINHTDLLLEKNANLMDQITRYAEVIIIDEAHHFRNRASSRYRKLFDMMQSGPKKQMLMMTATPINNSFLDLQHLIELFTHRQDDYFSGAPLGIHSLSGHFKKMEAKLGDLVTEEPMDISDDIFRGDSLVNRLVVQRSRSYVKKSLSATEGLSVMFSLRQPPFVANYSLKLSYGKLIDDFTKSFYRRDKETGRSITILSLPVYSPYEEEYFIGDHSKIDDMQSGRQSQIVNLIRLLLLKRFESSIAAFEETCIKIYIRLRKFLNDYREYGNTRTIDRTLAIQSDVWEYIERYAAEHPQRSIEDVEDELPDYVWNVEENLDIDDFDIHAMLDDTILDLDVLSDFIKDIMTFTPERDDKLRELKRILREDQHVVGKKVIIFSEYRATALYIYSELKKAGFKHLYEIDGESKEDRHNMIQRFAPYYNDLSSAEVKDEIQILIATDVLAEGLNLQDAACLVNYELHWNPVRLMQRVGRIDRRRNAEVEAKLLHDHPELASDREKAYYWNFLPPEELEKLLALYQTVSKKTLRISKAFGIEGKKLLKPDDDYEALKDFNSQYEGKASGDEIVALAYQELIADNPNYENEVTTLPKKMFSGRLASEIKGYFFCYELPIKRLDGTWSNGDGMYRWYILDTETGSVLQQPFEIWNAIKCGCEESRVFTPTEQEFAEKRKKIEDYIKQSYMRTVQAPIGIKPRLVTWMQLN